MNNDSLRIYILTKVSKHFFYFIKYSCACHSALNNKIAQNAFVLNLLSINCTPFTAVGAVKVKPIEDNKKTNMISLKMSLN